MGVYNGEPKASHCKAHTDRTRACEKKHHLEGKVFFMRFGHWTYMSKYHRSHRRERTGQKTINNS